MELVENQIYPVRVTRIDDKSIDVILLEDKSCTFKIHISEISNDFVDYIENFISVGNYYDAKAIRKKLKNGVKVQLSLRHLNLHNLYENKFRSTNLDAMIDSANRSFKDKMKPKKSKRRK